MINSFPGYEFVLNIGDDGKQHLKNMYRGIDLGMGGYVYADHGIYTNVALLDVASMHPTSLICLNYFGDYTKRFKDILDARLAIKHKDYDSVKSMFDGKLTKYLVDKEGADQLSNALKIALNSQYGLSSAHFDTPQRDVRNVNNIVALRGALFIKTLQDEIAKLGYRVIHCKTDSVKISNADQQIINFCINFAEQYGYIFEHEATYEKICLVTDADYIAKYKWAAKSKLIGSWTATGAKFSHPYVFKKLFTREPIEFSDLCEKKQVKTALYLDMNEDLEDNHQYEFVGRVGLFCPVRKGYHGGILLVERGDKFNAVSGTKGYRWLESRYIKDHQLEDAIDIEYFDRLADEAFQAIAEFGDARLFCSDSEYSEMEDDDKDIPICLDCGRVSCESCTQAIKDKYHIECADGFDNSKFIKGMDE